MINQYSVLPQYHTTVPERSYWQPHGFYIVAPADYGILSQPPISPEHLLLSQYHISLPDGAMLQDR